MIILDDNEGGNEDCFPFWGFSNHSLTPGRIIRAFYIRDLSHDPKGPKLVHTERCENVKGTIVTPDVLP